MAALSFQIALDAKPASAFSSGFSTGYLSCPAPRPLSLRRLPLLITLPCTRELVRCLSCRVAGDFGNSTGTKLRRAACNVSKFASIIVSLDTGPEPPPRLSIVLRHLSTLLAIRRRKIPEGNTTLEFRGCFLARESIDLAKVSSTRGHVASQLGNKEGGLREPRKEGLRETREEELKETRREESRANWLRVAGRKEGYVHVKGLVEDALPPPSSREWSRA